MEAAQRAKLGLAAPAEPYLPNVISERHDNVVPLRKDQS
jgi:hypothetical protein